MSYPMIVVVLAAGIAMLVQLALESVAPTAGTAAALAIMGGVLLGARRLRLRPEVARRPSTQPGREAA